MTINDLCSTLFGCKSIINVFLTDSLSPLMYGKNYRDDYLLKNIGEATIVGLQFDASGNEINIYVNPKNIYIMRFLEDE